MKSLPMIPPRRPSHIDGGFAWVALIATVITVAISLGTTYCASIYIVEWMACFSGNQETISWIGSLNLAIAFGTGPVSCSLSNRFGHRAVVMTGGVVSAAGYVGTALAYNLPTLYFTYGVITGFGVNLVYCPATIFVGHYFHKRMNFAMCLSSVGSCMGVMGIAPLFRALIRYYGWRGACIITGGVSLQSTLFGALFIPTSFWDNRKNEKRERPAIFEGALLRDYKTYLLMISYTLWTLGSMLFFLFIVDFCVQHGMTKDFAAYIISASAFCSLGCRLLLALTSVCVPNLPALEIYSFFCLLCGISLVILEVNDNVIYIAIICCLIHAFYGGIVAMLGLSTVQVFGMSRATSAYGYLNIGCGIGAFVGPPIAGRLYMLTESYKLPFYCGGAVLMSSALMALVILWRNYTRKSELGKCISTEVVCISADNGVIEKNKV